MNGWDRAKSLTQKNAGGVFLRLLNDGDKFVGALRGDPAASETHWGGEEYEECTGAGCAHCTSGLKLTTRVKMNVFLYPERRMTIWECSGKTFQDVLAVREKYGTEKWCFEVKRHGAAKSPKTKYSVLPERELTPEERRLADAAPLHALDSVDPATDEVADRAEGPIPAETSASFRQRIQALSLTPEKRKEVYYAVLGMFGCERLDEIPLAKEHVARGLIERAERGDVGFLSVSNSLDEFA